ncbi:unnamed protein product [Rhizophagus irregularis]|uniref:CCHC-type domain-containing protein n=1 Tax=Rhizophagus irregularis TaxID=588596 RepID=A0A915YQ42_9GLOM|nr:unnamed protein product [Rhizophagus irregularis]
MEFNAFCSDYHNNNYETSAFISTYSEPFNDNFTNINLSLYSEPFNINFLPSSLELSEPPFVSPVLPFVSPVEPLLTSDDNFTDIETSLPLEPSFGNSNYQYNLAVGDSFDDWLLVDTFMHQYCLERGFGYQIFRNDKDPNNSTIIRRKSFRCSSSGNYEPRKLMDQKLHRLRGTIKTNCEWHVNFTFPKSAHQIGCTTLKDVHNHEVNPAQISHIIARYRRLDSEMIQDLKFFSDCKVAPITQLEILKKKYPEHVFHKQDVYNAIYKLRQSNRDEKLDSVLFLNVLLEKMTQDPRWKIYIKHSGNECRLSGIFWMSPSQQELYQRFSDVVLNDNTSSTLCDIAETIDKRHQEEFKYCQLTDIKAKYTPIGLPHLSSQFFSSVDAIIVKFLSPFILSLQRYQISQSFTYEGQLTSYLFENLQAETIDDNFIEEVVDEPQITLKVILDGIDTSNIIEVWRIIRIGDDILDNSPVLTALESSTEVNTTSRTVDFTLQSLRQLQGSCHKENAQRIIPQRYRFGVAFSTAKTTINIALETGSDTELVKLLKDFILNKQRSRDGDGIESEIINVVVESNSQIVSLQENLINQTTNPYVTKIRGAPSKKRIKSAIEISGRSVIHDITSQTNIQQSNDGDITSRSQRKCSLCGKPGHYQKRCPNGRE